MPYDEAKIEIINRILGKDDIHWVFINVPEWAVKGNEVSLDLLDVIARDEGTPIPKAIVLAAGRKLVAEEFKEEKD